jgi:hypothetical protein
LGTQAEQSCVEFIVKLLQILYFLWEVFLDGRALIVLDLLPPGGVDRARDLFF